MTHFILYHCNTSYASQKVRLYLAEMGISWQGKHIDLRKQAHISSDYRTINPNGTVPALYDSKANKLICNSTDIMLYLDQHYVDADKKLSPQWADDVENFCRSHEKLHDPYLRTLSYHILFMNPDTITAEDKQRIMTLAPRHPNKQRGEFLLRVVKNEIRQEEIEQAKKAIVDELNHMNRLLQHCASEFLFSDQYTMADAAATATLFRVTKINMANAIAKHQALRAYYQNMVKRDNFGLAKMR
ncbi:MAG: glutathione S-transferase family protein [Pseudomonadota bacterium]